MVATLRALTLIFGGNNPPTRQAVPAIVDKCETKFTLLDVPVPKRRRIARSEEIIAAVSASIIIEPNLSIPRRFQQLGIAQTTLWCIMQKDLGLHAFKIKLTQELTPLDNSKSRNFSNWAPLDDPKDNIQREIANVPSKCVPEWWKIVSKKSTAVNGLVVVIYRYRISFIKCNACNTPTIHLNSISQIFLCFINRKNCYVPIGKPFMN